MRTERVDLAIVGAGPAGLSAALEAKAAGAEVLVVDENDRPGGQIFRHPPRAFRIEDRARLGRDYERGRALLDAVASAGIRIETNSTVWNIITDRSTKRQAQEVERVYKLYNPARYTRITRVAR